MLLLPYWVTSRLEIKGHQIEMEVPKINLTSVKMLIQMIASLEINQIQKEEESRYCNKETFHLKATNHSSYPFQILGPLIGLAEASLK